MSANEDRTVHAETSHAEIVRYDRAGRWYVEGKREKFRTPMNLKGVVEYCEYQEAQAVTVHWGRKGGQQFYKRLRGSTSPAIATPWESL